MFKLFQATIELAIPLFLLATVFFINRSYAPLKRRRIGWLTLVVFLIGLVTSAVVVYFRLFSAYINLPRINAITGSFVLIAQLLFLISLWIMWDKKLVTVDQNWRNYLLTGSSLLAILAVCLAHGITFFMGVNKIIPMGGSLFSTESLLNLAGYCLGALFVFVCCWGFTVGANRNIPWMRQIVSSLILLPLMFIKWVDLYQILAGLRLVKRSSKNFNLLLTLSNYESWMLIGLSLVALLPSVVAWITQIAQKIIIKRKTAEVDQIRSGPDYRSRKAESISRRRFFVLSAVAGSGMVFMLTVGKKIAEHVPELTPPEPSKVVGPEVHVQIASVSDGKLHRFAYKTQTGIDVRFIVIQKNEVSFGAGLDACEICGPSGYYERDGKVVCRRCDVIMNIQTIGFKGGCNPIPISFKQEEGLLKFKVKELEANAKIFT